MSKKLDNLPGRAVVPGRSLCRLSCLLILAMGLGSPQSLTAAEKDIFGWVEWIILGTDEIELKAKLDTGAETSSLDASSIRRLRRRSTGERFVEFELTNPESGKTVTFKKPLVREARIKQHDGSFQTRPVVVISVCLGDHLKNIEVSLIDRSEFLYPVLLGRSALSGHVVVDPDTTFTQEPMCDRNGGSD